ncbi:type VI secretion system-associated FHA domain protein TagH [Lichenicola cladoniae]|uniref:Type VI secretion system-associated FHA domain protein TagH n=1 Tax=Lichenicola cladoniae TaxID=1484109 RepID=A0A6M8HQD7_9PROT|nr:type VI secretion system-associated FHA domain protein TagH [Lichenicola cladoniae]NPD68068.1 type VI secretion system-associated FHA domain protein TagH [Acetobacteraceae bacterium]QKE90644.1 type VI secretion system-associated FHA domain protein TagH [Lichenicola cladoniae]
MLTLSMLRCPVGVPPESREISGAEFSIGRDQKNDWVLPDPDRFLSKRHCVLSFGATGWQIVDTSTNGTFLNHDVDPIRDAPRGLRDGDRILLGAYEMEVALQEGEEPLLRHADQRDPAHDSARAYAHDPAHDSARAYAHDPAHDPDRSRIDGHAGGAPYSDDRLLGDPFQSSPNDPLGLATGGNQIGLPERFDPLAPADELQDNAPIMQDGAFLEARYTPPRSSSDLLPDDWDDETPPPVRLTRAPPSPTDSLPPTTPEPLPPVDKPNIEAPRPVAAIPVPPAPEPLSIPADVTGPGTDPTAGPGNDFSTGPGADAGFAAFLQGAGMAPATMPTGAAAVSTLQALGGAFRAIVHGLRRIMIGRASIKGEFRIEQTMIRASGNNPLKFSADDEDALSALLNLGRRSELSPEAAIADALHDMRLHEVAMMTAMQEAVRELLIRLEPKRMMDQAGHHTLDAWPGARRARAWTAYETQHRQIVDALSDDFDSVFGKSFARAYERAMAEVQATPDDELSSRPRTRSQ